MNRPQPPKYFLDQLLIGMTPHDMREAFDWGPDLGREQVEYEERSTPEALD